MNVASWVGYIAILAWLRKSVMEGGCQLTGSSKNVTLFHHPSFQVGDTLPTEALARLCKTYVSREMIFGTQWWGYTLGAS